MGEAGAELHNQTQILTLKGLHRDQLCENIVYFNLFYTFYVDVAEQYLPCVLIKMKCCPTPKYVSNFNYTAM